MHTSGCLLLDGAWSDKAKRLRLKAGNRFLKSAKRDLNDTHRNLSYQCWIRVSKMHEKLMKKFLTVGRGLSLQNRAYIVWMSRKTSSSFNPGVRDIIKDMWQRVMMILSVDNGLARPDSRLSYKEAVSPRSHWGLCYSSHVSIPWVISAINNLGGFLIEPKHPLCCKCSSQAPMPEIPTKYFLPDFS